MAQPPALALAAENNNPNVISAAGTGNIFFRFIVSLLRVSPNLFAVHAWYRGRSPSGRPGPVCGNKAGHTIRGPSLFFNSCSPANVMVYKDLSAKTWRELELT